MVLLSNIKTGHNPVFEFVMRIPGCLKGTMSMMATGGVKKLEILASRKLLRGGG
jgi:hypothetical protein